MKQLVNHIRMTKGERIKQLSKKGGVGGVITSSLSSQTSESITNMSFTAPLSSSASIICSKCQGYSTNVFIVNWRNIYIYHCQQRFLKDTVSSFVSEPPPKKSIPANIATDFSRSSNGGNPHVFTCR